MKVVPSSGLNAQRLIGNRRSGQCISNQRAPGTGGCPFQSTHGDATSLQPMVGEPAAVQNPARRIETGLATLLLIYIDAMFDFSRGDRRERAG